MVLFFSVTQFIEFISPVRSENDVKYMKIIHF